MRRSFAAGVSAVVGALLLLVSGGAAAGQNDILCESPEHGQRLCLLGPGWEGGPRPPFYRVVSLRGTAHIAWQTKGAQPPPREEQSTIKGHSADWRISFSTPRGYRSTAFQIPYVQALPSPPLATKTTVSESWWNFASRRTCSETATKERRDRLGFYTGRTKGSAILAYRVPEPRPCAEKHVGSGVYIGPGPDWDGNPDTEPDYGGTGYVFAVRVLSASQLRKRLITIPLVVDRTWDTDRGGKPWLETRGRVRWSGSLVLRRVSRVRR